MNLAFSVDTMNLRCTCGLILTKQERSKVGPASKAAKTNVLKPKCGFTNIIESEQSAKSPHQKFSSVFNNDMI